ncbi:unnamed protein product [Sphagnum troendelagicum]
MGKTKDNIWSKFGQSYKHGDAKLSYCKCSACDEPVITTAGCMRDHWAKCLKHPHAIGQLDAGFQPSRKSAKTWIVQSSSAHSLAGNGGSTVGELVEPLNPLPFFISSRQHFDSLKKGKLEKLHQLFTCNVHRTAMLYSAFEHPTWKDFFQALCGYFQLPSSTAIGGDLMRAEYAITMNDVLLALSKHSLICFTLDNATNLQGKQVINMMACGPKPFFLEHFTMELRRESVANLLEKLLNCATSHGG